MDREKLLKTIVFKPHKLGWLLGYEYLTDIHSKWIRESWDVPYSNTLQAHRNSYKTTALMVVGAIRWLILHRNDRILFQRKNVTEAQKTLAEVRRHYEKPIMLRIYESIFERKFSYLTQKSTNEVLELCLKTGSSREANIETAGIGTSITGRHYNRVLNDDIITIDDRVSRTARENTKLFVQELQNIPVIDGGTNIYSGTPWHQQDAFSILPPAKKYPIGSVQIRGLTEEKIKELKQGMTRSLWAANYELVHVADENRTFDEPKYVDWLDVFRPVAWLDPAYQGDNTTALCLIHKTADESYFVTGWVWRQDVTTLYSVISEKLREYKAGTLYVESNADKGLSARDLLSFWPAVEPINESENKHIKIVSNLKKNWPAVYFNSACQGDFMNQVLDYQEGEEPDDAPDAVASLIRQLNRKVYKRHSSE